MVLTSPEIANGMAEKFDTYIDQVAFRLELHTDEEGFQHIRWHGLENGQQRVYSRDPYSSFWQRLGVGIMRLLPIESQL